jgi:tetratricopeptide (TPR) repeat protein
MIKLVQESRLFLTSAEEYRHQGLELHHQGEHVAALHVFQNGLNDFPDNPDLLRCIGHQKFTINESGSNKPYSSSEILEYFRTAYELNPNDFRCAFDYARGLRIEGHFDESEDLLFALLNEESLKDRNNQPVLSQLSKLYKETDDPEFEACCYYGTLKSAPKDKGMKQKLNKLEITMGICIDEENWEDFLDHGQSLVNEAHANRKLLMYLDLHP